MTLSQDESALANDRADAAVGTAGGAGSPTYTELPTVGQVIARGQELFAINGGPSCCSTAASRRGGRFMPGMTPGPDVAQLNANLEALGYGRDLGATTSRPPPRRPSNGSRRPTDWLPTGQLPWARCCSSRGRAGNGGDPDLGSTPSPGPGRPAGDPYRPPGADRPRRLGAVRRGRGRQVSIVMPNNTHHAGRGLVRGHRGHDADLAKRRRDRPPSTWT